MKKILAILFGILLLCTALGTSLAKESEESGALSQTIASVDGVSAVAIGYSVIKGESLSVTLAFENNSASVVHCGVGINALCGILLRSDADETGWYSEELQPGEKKEMTVQYPLGGVSALLGTEYPDTVEIDAYAWEELPDDEYKDYFDEYVTIALPGGVPAQRSLAALKAEGRPILQNQRMELMDLGYLPQSNTMALYVSFRPEKPDEQCNVTLSPVVNGHRLIDDMDIYKWYFESEEGLHLINLDKQLQFIGADSLETLQFDVDTRLMDDTYDINYEYVWWERMTYDVRLPYPPDEAKLNAVPPWPVLYEDARVCVRCINPRYVDEDGISSVLLDLENKSDCIEYYGDAQYLRIDGAEAGDEYSVYIATCAPQSHRCFSITKEDREPYDEDSWMLVPRSIPEEVRQIQLAFDFTTYSSDSYSSYYTPVITIDMYP